MASGAEILSEHPARAWLPKTHAYDHRKILSGLTAEIRSYLQYKIAPADRLKQAQKLLLKVQNLMRGAKALVGYVSTVGPLLSVTGSYANGTASVDSPIDVCVLILTPNSMESIVDPKLWFAFSQLLLAAGYVLQSTVFYPSIVRTTAQHPSIPVPFIFYYYGKELMNNTERAVQLFREGPSLQQLHCLIKAICRHKRIHGTENGNLSSHYLFLLIQAFSHTLLPKQMSEDVGNLLVLFTNFISNYDERIYCADVQSANILCEQKHHRTEPYFEIVASSRYEMQSEPYKYCVFKDTMTEIARLLRYYETPEASLPISIVSELCGF